MKDAFTETMMDTYRRTLKETGYNAHYFHQLIADRGGYEAAMDLIHSQKPPPGFTELDRLGRLDLTVEALILNPKWRDIFSDADRQAAYNRLKEYGYQFPKDSWQPRP
jgi:hypothetical protein